MNPGIFKLKVIKPCTEDWGVMTLSEKGRFCQSCSKEVIDFSTLSDEQIQNFFNNNTRSVCGRFRNQQLERIRIQLPTYFFKKKIPLWQKYLVVFLICFGSNLYSIDVSFDTYSPGLHAQTIAAIQSNKEKPGAAKKKRKKKKKDYTIPITEFVTLGFTTAVPVQTDRFPKSCDPWINNSSSRNDSSINTNEGYTTNHDNNKREPDEKKPRKNWEFILPVPIALRRKK